MQAMRRGPAQLLSLVSLAVVMFGHGGAVVANDLTFQPYTVYVVQEHSHTRCGPSADEYRTDELRHGQSLKVYAETDDGWLGIQPPETSFCWIPAETVKLDVSGDTGIVTEDRTVAWIGTHLGRARQYKWQVQLAKGEPVTVIGRSEREGPDGPQMWFRIVPPSGEFRWVHRDQVVLTSEELVASLQPSADEQRQNEAIEFQPAPRRSKAVAQTASARNPEPQTTRSSSSRRTRDYTAATGASVLSVDVADDSTGQAIGSGLAGRDAPVSDAGDSWQAADSIRQVNAPELATGQTNLSSPVIRDESAGQLQDDRPSGLLHSLAKLGRPRLLQIGSGTAPAPGQQAGDDNWVAGTSRPAISSTAVRSPETQRFAQPLPNPSGPIMQVSGGAPMPAQTLVAPQQGLAVVTPSAMPELRPMHHVSGDRIDQIERETSTADVDGLSLILSRLMAGQASAPETAAVARAARALSASSHDPVVQGRARLLAERAEQYARVATRRDGEAVVLRNDLTTVDSAVSGFVPAVMQTSQSIPLVDSASAAKSASADGQVIYTGQLVQVYSARPHSPPYALTDGTGRTVAYVTPAPGVNLRSHLNNQVNVIGKGGFVQGLNLPHVLAGQAVRVAL